MSSLREIIANDRSLKIDHRGVVYMPIRRAVHQDLSELKHLTMAQQHLIYVIKFLSENNDGIAISDIEPAALYRIIKTHIFKDDIGDLSARTTARVLSVLASYQVNLGLFG